MVKKMNPISADPSFLYSTNHRNITNPILPNRYKEFILEEVKKGKSVKELLNYVNSLKYMEFLPESVTEPRVLTFLAENEFYVKNGELQKEVKESSKAKEALLVKGYYFKNLTPQELFIVPFFKEYYSKKKFFVSYHSKLSYSNLFGFFRELNAKKVFAASLATNDIEKFPHIKETLLPKTTETQTFEDFIEQFGALIDALVIGGYTKHIQHIQENIEKENLNFIEAASNTPYFHDCVVKKFKRIKDKLNHNDDYDLDALQISQIYNILVASLYRHQRLDLLEEINYSHNANKFIKKLKGNKNEQNSLS